MKKFYLFIFIALFVTVGTVAVVPGADDYVEQTFQRYLGQAAR